MQSNGRGKVGGKECVGLSAIFGHKILQQFSVTSAREFIAHWCSTNSNLTP